MPDIVVEFPLILIAPLVPVVDEAAGHEHVLAAADDGGAVRGGVKVGIGFCDSAWAGRGRG